MSDTPNLYARPDAARTPAPGPAPTREQYQDQLTDAQLYAGHQRLHPIGHRNRDAALSEAITQITMVAPWVRQAPRFVVDIANDAIATGRLHEVLVDVRDMDGFLDVLRQREELRRADVETQRKLWSSMPRGAQQALLTQGYQPPGEEVELLRRLSYEQEAGIMGGVADAMGFVGDAIGTGLELLGGNPLRETGEWIWDRFTDASRVPATLYRQARLTGSETWDPGHFVDSWKRAWHNEENFEPDVARDVAEMYEDEEAFTFVARLASGESVYDIAGDLAEVGTPEYLERVREVMDFADHELVVEGVAKLRAATISPGRDLARNVLGLRPGSAPFTVVSGAADAAFTWFTDPTLVAGKINKARLFRKLGLVRVGGNVVNRVQSFYGPNMVARAAVREVTDVADPGYLRALQGADLNPTERAATMIADHVAQGRYAELMERMPQTSRLIRTLEDYHREVPIRDAADVARFFSGEAGLTALVRGDLAHYRYGFSTLPRLTKAGTAKVRTKVALEEAIDFAADAHVRLRSPIAVEDYVTGAARQGANEIGQQLSLLLSPAARAFQRATTLLPATGHLIFGTRESVQLFDQFLDYGVRGQTRREIFNRFIRAQTEAEARAAYQSGLKTIFANAGLLDDPDLSDFVRTWLDRSKHRYALDDVDRMPTGERSGIWPDADRADGVAFPQFREIVAEVRRQRLNRVLTGWGGKDFTNAALRIWNPVASTPERFMRVWRPAVLIRPAFPLRAGGEEAIAQYARLGPGHTIKQWLLLPSAAADPGTSGWARLLTRPVDMLFSGLGDDIRLSASSAAQKTAAAVEARFRRLALRGVDRADVRAWRDRTEALEMQIAAAKGGWSTPLFVDLVGEAYDEVAGVRVGIQGAALGEPDPRTFASVVTHTQDGPIRVDFAKVNGRYDEYATKDPLGRQILADTAAHVGRDRVARARLAVRSLFLDEDQAVRIANVLRPSRDLDLALNRRRLVHARLNNPVLQREDHLMMATLQDVTGGRPIIDEDTGQLLVGDFTLDEIRSRAQRMIDAEDPMAATPNAAADAARSYLEDLDEALRPMPERPVPLEVFEEIAQLRLQIAALPQPVRAKLVRAADGDEKALNEVRLVASTRDGSLADALARFMQLNVSDRRALLADPTRAFAGIDKRLIGGHWEDLLARVQRGDRRAWEQLEDEVAIARMNGEDLADHISAMDRMRGVDDFPLPEEVPGVTVEPLVGGESLALTSASRRRIRINSEAIAANYAEGLPYERGAAGTAGSTQKAAVFAQQGVDLDELYQWFEANGGARSYERFVLAHERAHIDLHHGGTPQGQWSSPESIRKEIDANEVAFRRLGMPFGSARYAISRDQALRDWARVQRQALDQVTLTSDGRVVHGIAQSLADESFHPLRHVVDADYALPPEVHGPAVQRIEGRSLSERAVNGFFDWAGGVIRAMARQPLWQHAYANAYREADVVLGQIMRNADLRAGAERIFGSKIDDASDTLIELEHRMEEAYRAGQSERRAINELNDVDLGEVLKHHLGVSIDHADLAATRAWWGNERRVRDQLSMVAAERATNDVIPYIDDHRIRSQAADLGRHIAPFWFAQEQFYKRWARTFRQSPEAIARVQLAHHALRAVGWIEMNEHGEEQFVYPGSAWTNMAIAKLFDLLPGDSQWSLPLATPLTGQLQHAAPGFDDIGALPSAGPLVAVPVGVVRQLVPEVGVPLENAVIDRRGRGRTFMEQILPTSLQRLWAVTGGWDPEDASRDVLGAIQLLEANGDGPPENASAAEIEAYFDRVRNHARVLGITRLIFGLTGPASPSVDLNPEDLKGEFQQMLQADMPIEEAVQRYLAEHPDATVWTVFATTSPSKAPIEATEEVLAALRDHDSFYSRYRASGAWLLPETPPGDPEFSGDAWRELLAHEMRVRKTDTEMWRDLKFAQAAPVYFDSAERVEQALAAATTPEARNVIRAQWRSWKEQYLALHPVFAEMYEGTDNRDRREQVLRELPEALADPDVPDSEHTQRLATMLDSYQRTMQAVDATLNDRSEFGRNYRRMLKENLDTWARTYAEGHPTLQAFYLRIIRPQLELPTTSEEQ